MSFSITLEEATNISQAFTNLIVAIMWVHFLFGPKHKCEHICGRCKRAIAETEAEEIRRLTKAVREAGGLETIEMEGEKKRVIAKTLSDEGKGKGLEGRR